MWSWPSTPQSPINTLECPGTRHSSKRAVLVPGLREQGLIASTRRSELDLGRHGVTTTALFPTMRTATSTVRLATVQCHATDRQLHPADRGPRGRYRYGWHGPDRANRGSRSGLTTSARMGLEGRCRNRRVQRVHARIDLRGYRLGNSDGTRVVTITTKRGGTRRCPPSGGDG